jgi:TonB family protein
MRRHVVHICLAIIFVAPAFGARYPENVWKARFTHRVFPDYPRVYRKQRFEGNGVFRMHVDEQGRIRAITILKSTGHRELDALAMNALIQWHGLPGPKWELDMPITFTMNMSIQPKNPADAKTYR